VCAGALQGRKTVARETMATTTVAMAFKLELKLRLFLALPPHI